VEVAQHIDELRGSVACVTFAKPPLIKAFEREMDLPLPIFGDPERHAYRAMGFERASWRRVWLEPRVWARYAVLLSRGRRAKPVDQDTQQLGGDVVLDREGRITWIYRSDGPEDRPPVERVLAAMREAE